MREMTMVTYERTNLASPYTFEDDRDGPTLSRMTKDVWQDFENADLVIFRNSLGRFFIMKTVKETFMRKWFSDEEYDQVIETITRWYDEKHRIKIEIVQSRVTAQTRRIQASWPAEVEEELAAGITEEGRRTLDAAEIERRDRIYETIRGLRERYAIQPLTTNEFRLSPVVGPAVDVIETDHTAIATSPNTVTDVSPWFTAAEFQRIPEIQSNRRLYVRRIR